MNLEIRHVIYDPAGCGFYFVDQFNRIWGKRYGQDEDGYYEFWAIEEVLPATADMAKEKVRT